MVYPSFPACIYWKIDLLEFEGYCVYVDTFRRIYFKHQFFLRATYIFQNTTTCSHPFFEVVHNFIQEKNFWQRSILSNVLAFFEDTGAVAVINSFKAAAFIARTSSVLCLFPKKLMVVIRFFRGTTIIRMEDTEPLILSKVLPIFLTLKFAAIHFVQLFSKF